MSLEAGGWARLIVFCMCRAKAFSQSCHTSVLQNRGICSLSTFEAFALKETLYLQLWT